MRALLWMAVLAAVLVGLVLAGNRTAWQVPWVTLKVENATRGGVSVRLTRNGTTRDHGALAPGEVLTVRYYGTAPVTFRLEARLAAGAVHHSGAGGVRPGWTVHARVHVRGIENAFQARGRALPALPWADTAAP